MGLWIEAKKLIGDWIGVIEVTRLADEQTPSADNIYYRAEAFSALGEIAQTAGHLQLAAERCLEGGKEVDDAFRKGQARGRVVELNDMRHLLFRNYVLLKDRLTPDPDEHIEVWLATMEAFDGFVRRPLLIKLGSERLTSWWSAVEARYRYDSKSANLMEVQLHKLDRILDVLGKQELPDTELIQMLRGRRDNLHARWRSYAAVIDRGGVV